MNEDLMRENRVPHTEAMKYFTRVGLAVLLMFVARKIVVLLTVNILELAAPVLCETERIGGSIGCCRSFLFTVSGFPYIFSYFRRRRFLSEKRKYSESEDSSVFAFRPRRVYMFLILREFCCSHFFH